ncbi:MAG: Asp-tRNA(Asn)/Glu-tRNA(Gln) amidotransferase subunit GatC [Phycisphaeraceae bacterium]
MAEKIHPISEDDVRHAARLSRLTLSDDQVEHFTGQFADVLNYIAKLNELDVENVEPMAHALDLANVLREDAERAGLTVDQALANAPDQAPPFFKVPKVLGEGSGA